VGKLSNWHESLLLCLSVVDVSDLKIFLSCVSHAKCYLDIYATDNFCNVSDVFYRACECGPFVFWFPYALCHVVEEGGLCGYLVIFLLWC
jgi:hypothetical protein